MNANQTGLPNDTIRRAIHAWFVKHHRFEDLPPNFASRGTSPLGAAAAAAIRVIEQASGIAPVRGIAGDEVLRVLRPFLPPQTRAVSMTARGRLAAPPFARLVAPKVIGQRAPSYIVLHLTETDSGNDDRLTIEQMAASMAQGPFGATALASVDGRIGRTGTLFDMNQHVLHHNAQCIGIEQLCSREDLPRETWLDKRIKQIWVTAWWVAWVGQECGIPLVQAADDGRVFTRDSGVMQHRHVPDNDHTDCGDGYPLDVVLRLAREFQDQGVPGAIRDALPSATLRFGPPRSVIASTFSDRLGYRGDDLRSGALPYAELSTDPTAAELDFAALGGLAYRTQVRVTTEDGARVVAEKLDIGAGGPSLPKIDLHARTAARLGLPADFLGPVTIEIERPR